MKTRSKAAIGSIAAVLAVFVAWISLSRVDVREIGRTDPKRAANYRLPSRNFAETYAEGEVLGVVVGSTRAEAIKAAERAGLTVDPSSWGDNRAGGAGLYDRPTLTARMLAQPHLNFAQATDRRRGMTIHFRGDRVSRIDLHYINTEAL